MTDAEWEALSRLLAPRRPPSRGRPPAQRREAWDAIFWVACSSGPWSALPPQLGKADTVHRALRRAAAAGRLGLLLFALARKAIPQMQSLEWRLVRAYRRMFRVMPGSGIAVARRLGLLSALPCHPRDLPDPRWHPLLLALGSRVVLRRPLVIQPGESRLIRALMALCRGNPAAWRTTG
jgi:transposase